MKTLFFSAMMFGLYVFIQQFAGSIEGRFFPVVEDTEIYQVEPVGVASTRIWGSFVKIRECDFKSIEFSLVVGGKPVVADFAFEEPASVRIPGRQAFGPWRVQLTEEQLSERSVAVVYHECPLFTAWGKTFHRPWLTETKFYPS